MPQGWLHGRLGAIATIEVDDCRVDLALTKLFEGDTEGFVAWVGEQTESLVKAYDLEMRDADLETVTNFMLAKARRTLPFTVPDRSATVAEKDGGGIFPFLNEGWDNMGTFRVKIIPGAIEVNRQ